MSDQATCGQGLAERSALHRAMADLLEAIQDNLDAHLPSLSPRDADAAPEREAYTVLLGEHRQLVESLRGTAARMAGYRDLPMPEHDPDALGSPRVMSAFRDYVTAQDRLLELLRKGVAEDRAMLQAAGG